MELMQTGTCAPVLAIIENCSDSDQMDYFFLENLIKQLEEAELRALMWGGKGEPANHTEFASLLKLTKLKQGLQTNGIYLGDRASIGAIVENLEWIEIKLIAGSLKVYTSISGGGSAEAYWKIIANMELLSSYRAKIKSSVVLGTTMEITTINIDDIIETAKHVSDVGFHYLYCDLSHLGNDQALIDKATENISKGRELGKGSDFAVYMAGFEPKEDIFQNKCYCHHLVTVINNYQLWVCPYKVGDSSYRIGDLRTASFKQLWYSEIRQQLINSLKYTGCPVVDGVYEMNEFLYSIIDLDVAHQDFLLGPYHGGSE